MVWSGGPDPVLGGAARQKVETGMPAGIQSCRKACQHVAPPEETRGESVQPVEYCIMELINPVYCILNGERRREAAVCGAG